MSGSDEAPIALGARGVAHAFGPTTALRGVDLDIRSGEIVAIMGPSGSGKSTLLHMLAGVLTPDEGTVTFDGRVISALGEPDRARLRLAEFGFVFQFGQLVPDLTSVDNVSLPLLLTGMPRRKALRVAAAQLDVLGLGDGLGKHPAELSGGQAQRTALARALVTRPRVLFADEPTGALDSLTAEHVMHTLTSQAQSAGTTVVLITHDARTAAYADREIVVRDGRVTADARGVVS